MVSGEWDDRCAARDISGDLRLDEPSDVGMDVSGCRTTSDESDEVLYLITGAERG